MNVAGEGVWRLACVEIRSGAQTHRSHAVAQPHFSLVACPQHSYTVLYEPEHWPFVDNPTSRALDHVATSFERPSPFTRSPVALAHP